MQTVIVIFFWTCAACVVYAYLGYPLLIWCLARAFGRGAEPPIVGDPDLPSVTLLIVAHNEQAVIGQRLRNALALDYPVEKLQIVVASDGSSDATTQIVRNFVSRHGVCLLDDGVRRGKAGTLNAAFPNLAGDVVILSDANVWMDGRAARKLARWFRDPRVGAVCGRLILTDPATGRNADGVYWKYETFLKRCEGRLGALLGANGALYAIRKGHFPALPSDTIVDDLALPLLIRLRGGGATVYDAEAIAYEETAPDLRHEFGRRARIGAGGFQAISVLWQFLDPRKGWIALTFFSHKVLRWICPFLLLGALLSTLLLSHQAFYRYLLLIQGSCYAAALIGPHLPVGRRLRRVLRLGQMFTLLNAALLVGFCRWLRGTQAATWEPTARLAELRRAT